VHEGETPEHAFEFYRAGQSEGAIA
jgi:hypothetical protein